MKFKNNDKVRILAKKAHPWSGNSGIPLEECIGKIGYVWINDLINMRVNSQPNDTGDYYGIFEKNELELVNEHNFEVGKWYKWYQKEHSAYHYGKIKNIIDESYFSASPWIINTINYNNKGTFRISGAQEVQEIKDLTEIQQYLPDNHPDKIKEENLVGRYLKALVDGPQNAGFKKNDYVKIVSKLTENQYGLEGTWVYTTYSNTSNHWELMPEGFVPHEYVEFLRNYTSTFKQGEIWKKVDYNFFERNGKQAYCSLKEAYKPSTKEAYEAQFKTMDEYLTVNDLEKYKVYCSIMPNNPEWESLHLYVNGTNLFRYRLYVSDKYKQERFNNTFWGQTTENKYRLATEEETKWLHVCAKNNKFIPKSELDLYDDESYLLKIKTMDKEQSIEDILEEAKRRFPIGCVFINTAGNKFTLKEDNVTYKIVGNTIFTHSGAGYLYRSGKWAELVSLPEESKSEEYIPKVGDYIVWTTDNDVLLVTKVKKDKHHDYWIEHTPTSFSGGGFGWKTYKNRIRKAEPHEIPNESKPEPMEEEHPLILEARVRYPIGSKVIPAHIDKDGEYIIITKDSEFTVRGNCVYSRITTTDNDIYQDGIWVNDSCSYFSKYGNTRLSRCVYNGKQWARIHQEPEIKVKDPTENLSMNIVQNYTIDEAYDILIQRGFNRVKRYYYRYEDGNLDKNDIRSVETKVTKKHDNYIEFGCGYLWSKNHPHLIADVDMVVEWEEEPSNKPTYSIEGRQPFTDKSQIIKGNKAIVISESRSSDSENYCRPGSLVTIDENNSDNPYVINENGNRVFMYIHELSPFEENLPLEEASYKIRSVGKTGTLFFREEIQIPPNLYYYGTDGKPKPNKHWMLQTTLED